MSTDPREPGASRVRPSPTFLPETESAGVFLSLGPLLGVDEPEGRKLSAPSVSSRELY